MSDSIGFVIGGATFVTEGSHCYQKSWYDNNSKTEPLINLFPDENLQKEEAWLLYPQRKALSHSAQLLIDFLLQELPKSLVIVMNFMTVFRECRLDYLDITER